jgi:hypothetical protein
MSDLVIIDEQGYPWTVRSDAGEEGSYLRALSRQVLLLDGLLRERSAEGRAEIEDGSIVIRIGIDCLPAIVSGGPHSDNIEVVDANLFATELVLTLQEEAEDGTTLVHRMFDSAILRAYENGADGVKEAAPAGGL